MRFRLLRRTKSSEKRLVLAWRITIIYNSLIWMFAQYLLLMCYICSVFSHGVSRMHLAKDIENVAVDVFPNQLSWVRTSNVCDTGAN